MAGERILIVDDEKSMCQFLTIMLRKEGYQITAAANGAKALEQYKGAKFDLVITDIRMAGMDGIELLSELKKLDPTVPVIIMTAYASQKSAIDAVNHGAFHYLIKQAKNEEIRMVVRNALDMKRVRQENMVLRKELKKTGDLKTIVGKSEEMEKVFRLVEKVAETDSTILIYGESGTGKELIAREIHFRSSRANNPFVSINCGALPESLLESELFGHVKGSFTGAIRDKEGLFKVAQGGTLLPRRGRGDVADHPGEAPARAPGARDHPRRRDQPDQGRRPAHRRDQRRSREGGRPARNSARTSSTGST